MSFVIDPFRFVGVDANGPQIVQVGSNTSNGSSISVALDNLPNEGNHLLAFTFTSSNSVLLNPIAGYTSVQYQDLDQGEFRLMIKEAGSAESSIVSASRVGDSTITNLTLVVVEISGLNSSSLVDQVAHTDRTTNDALSLSSGTTSMTDTANEIAVSFAMWYDDDLSGPTWSNDFANIDDDQFTAINSAYGYSWATAARSLSELATVETESSWNAGDLPERGACTVVTLRGT